MKEERFWRQIGWWWVAALLFLLLILIETYKYWRKRRRIAAIVVSPTLTAAVSSSVSPTYISTPNIPEIVTSNMNLTGIAPTGAKWGINTDTGQTFLVDSTGNWQAIATNSVIPITAVFTPSTHQNGQSLLEDVTVTGVELNNHYSLAIVTPLAHHEGIEITMMVVADDKVRVSIVNETGQELSLPALTISALKLN